MIGLNEITFSQLCHLYQADALIGDKDGQLNRPSPLFENLLYASPENGTTFDRLMRVRVS